MFTFSMLLRMVGWTTELLESVVEFHIYCLVVVQFFVEIMYPPLKLPLFACQSLVYLLWEMEQNIGQESETGKCYPPKYLKKKTIHFHDTQPPDY